MGLPALGEQLRKWRTERGLTQVQLAELAHLDHTYLSKIENDRVDHTPSVKALRDLASALQVDELELMQLAGKLPAILEPFAQSPEAARFLSRAAETMTEPKDWKELLSFLERRQARKR